MRKVFLGLLIALAIVFVYAKRKYEEYVFLDKIELENIALAYEMPDPSPYEIKEIAPEEKLKASLVTEKISFLRFVAAHGEERFKNAYLQFYYNKPESDREGLTYSERAALFDELREQEVEFLKKAGDELVRYRGEISKYIKDNVEITFEKHPYGGGLKLKKITSLTYREPLPYKIKYFSEFRHVLPVKECKAFGSKISDIACRTSIRYSDDVWPAPEDFLRKINPATFKIYATAYFSSEKSSINNDYDINGDIGSSVYIFATCVQLDIYEDGGFKKIAKSVSCDKLNSRPLWR